MPCSGSSAEPENVTESPSVDSEPFVGKLIETVGGWFSGMNSFTVMVTCVKSLIPPLSVTDAVMVWTPADRFVLLKKVPVPREPSLLEVH